MVMNRASVMTKIKTENVNPRTQETRHVWLRQFLSAMVTSAIRARDVRVAVDSLYLLNSCFPEEPLDEHTFGQVLSIKPKLLLDRMRPQRHLQWPHIHLLSLSFDGTDRDALITRVNVLRHFSRSALPSYDATWTILEAWEQLGARVHPGGDAGELFIQSYVEICLKTPNTFLKGAMTWGLNEFLERGRQVEIGKEIGRRLINEITRRPDTTVTRVLHVLSELKDELKEVTEERGFQLPRQDRETIALKKLADGAIRRFDEESGLVAGVRRLASLPEVKELIGWWHSAKSGQGMGIAAMGRLKLVLGHVAERAKAHYRLIRDLCAPILRKVDSERNFSTFLAIELLEAVREEAPAHCARVMGEYLRYIKSEALAFGIDVCMAEHYEYGGEKSSSSRYRLAGGPRRWKAIEKYPQLPKNDLDCFFPLAAKALNARPELAGLAYWINRRLDQHPSIISANRG